MTILHRTREEAAKRLRKERATDVVGPNVSPRELSAWRRCRYDTLKRAEHLVRSMPLPEATEADREGLARAIAEHEAREFFNSHGAAIPTNPQWWIDHVTVDEEHKALADAVLAWLRSKP